MDVIFGGNLEGTIRALGYIGVALIVFAESGLFFGFFLPGDSLLFTAGLLASQGFLDIYKLTFILAVFAITGDSVGYWFGRKIGPALFDKEDSFFFHKGHIAKTRAFYERHGPKAVVLARFVPVVRTFVPIMAGVGGMRYGLFFRYNVIGGLLWTIGLTVAGYTLGKSVPNVDTYLLPIILAIITLSFLPVIVEVIRAKAKNNEK